jgi:type IV pilus assembly protein PilE
MKLNYYDNKSKGITLIELMIVVAIIAVISAIAIPAYEGYVKEARLSTARASIDSLRLFLEDYRLDNDCYSPGCGGSKTYDLTNITSTFDWNPRDDDNGFDYALTVTNDTYTANVSWASTVIVSCTQNTSALNCTYTE